MSKALGRIIKIDSGYFYIFKENKIYECRTRGKTKNSNNSFYVGDIVSFTTFDEDKGIIEGIELRKNSMDRPKIANVDQMLLVMSLSYPKLDYNVLDRLLVTTLRNGIKPVILFNKLDQFNIDEIKGISKIYEAYDKLFISAKTGVGLQELKELVRDKLSVLAGPSGVGKSSILNALEGKVLNSTGSLGMKIKRGKHTTRVSSIYLTNEGLIADTPGFSRVNFPKDMEVRELPDLYLEYNKVSNKCKFKGCLHYMEKDCEVKNLVGKGLLDEDRYERYRYFIEELKDLEERRYK